MSRRAGKVTTKTPPGNWGAPEMKKSKTQGRGKKIAGKSSVKEKGGEEWEGGGRRGNRSRRGVFQKKIWRKTDR